ncbi:hypothetical protein WK03_32020 [Burkholderia cepacia]|nr:hypothetical protein WK03_32020 [Burkholderia cepacia]
MFEDKRFEYDVYGRLVRKLSGHGPAKELTLEYDDWNQLKTVVTKDRLGISTTHFEYDAFGRRVRKLNGSYASTDFLWDGMRLVQETYHDRQGEEALTYLYESNSYVPLARIDQGKAAANDADVRDAVYYFHNDVSGLPEELTDAGGELVWQARYKVWGNAVQEEWVARVPDRPAAVWGDAQAAAPVPAHVPRPQNLRFQGQYLDRETGLHYNTFRFYDPDIGRFINPDPIGLAGGRNLYQYAPNPISWIDPWGWASTNNPGVYDVYSEARIPREMYRMSDGKHFQEANRQLYYQMKNDPELKASLESKYPGIYEEVSPGKRGAFPREAPTGTSWHHHERVGGLLQLVDSGDHNSRHLDYHPKGYGGRKTWGGGSGCR